MLPGRDPEIVEEVDGWLVAAACTQKTSMKQGRCKAIFRGLVRERTYRSYRHTLLRQESLLHGDVSVAMDE